jgi:hypothetical protein
LFKDISKQDSIQKILSGEYDLSIFENTTPKKFDILVVEVGYNCCKYFVTLEELYYNYDKI